MTIAPQTYYRWLACPIRPTELEEAYLVNQIVDIYRRNKCMYREPVRAEEPGPDPPLRAARRQPTTRCADRGCLRAGPAGPPYCRADHRDRRSGPADHRHPDQART